MISYRSSHKISSYLVWVKLYLIERIVGCYTCGRKSCQYITEADTFTSSVTGETFKINDRCDCNAKCLVYLFTCNKCKNKTLVKQQTTSVEDETTASLKIEVLIEENSVCKNICTDILKVKVIQVSVTMFLQYKFIRLMDSTLLKQKHTGYEP